MGVRNDFRPKDVSAFWKLDIHGSIDGSNKQLPVLWRWANNRDSEENILQKNGKLYEKFKSFYFACKPLIAANRSSYALDNH